MTGVRGKVTGDPLRSSVIAVATVTILSGLVQLVAPGAVLDMIGASSTPSTRHFFAIIGMFMAVVGGLVLHAELARHSLPLALLWGSFQKYGAAIAVASGVSWGIFGSLALLVAAFDLLSGALMTWRWRQVRS